MRARVSSNVDQFLFRAAEEVLGRNAARGMRVSGLRAWYYRVLAGTAAEPSGWQMRLIFQMIEQAAAEIAELEADEGPQVKWNSKYDALRRQRAALIRFCALRGLREEAP